MSVKVIVKGLYCVNGDEHFDGRTELHKVSITKIKDAPDKNGDVDGADEILVFAKKKVMGHFHLHGRPPYLSIDVTKTGY